MSEVVYKYRAPSRINDLRSRTLRLTQPGSLNDPFEALPAVTGAWSPKQLEALVGETHRLANADGHTLAEREVIAEFEEHNQLARELGTEWIGKLANDLFGIVSFSRTASDPLMWAHYAADHRGFVVGFDGAHSWFARRREGKDPINHLAPVTYSPDRPKVFLDGARLEGGDEQARWAAALFGTKSLQWRYEKELRLVMRLDDADTVEGEVHLLGFPPDLVREIVFGSRMSFGDRAALLEVLEDPAYSHVVQKCARVSTTKYEINLVEN